MPNPFYENFDPKISFLENTVASDFAKYSNLAFEYSYAPLPEDPEDSFERTFHTIRFDEKIYGTEDGE